MRNRRADAATSNPPLSCDSEEEGTVPAVDSIKASMRPEAAVDDPEPQQRLPALQAIKLFTPTGTEDDKAAYTIPAYCALGIESTVALLKPWSTSIARVTLWAFTTGLHRLDSLPAVHEICSARADLLRRGSSVTFLDWRYCLSQRGAARERTFFRYVNPADASKAKTLAIGLGLGQQASGTIAALAIMSALVDVPLTGELPRQIERELSSFVETLRERRELVANLSARDADQSLAAVPRRSWEDISRDK